MKKLTVILLILLAVLPSAGQVFDVLDIVRADRDKAAGCEGSYRFEQGLLTKAPKGYKPVYISHYARHGSRYAWNSKTYTLIRDVMAKAHERGVLTERGKRFFDDYMKFYEIPLENTGDLTSLGWQQHGRIASEVFSLFPSVFKKDRKVFAMSSVSQRAIVSMNAFCVGLQRENTALRIEANSLHTNMKYVNPPAQPLEKYQHRKLPVPGGEKYSDFMRRKLDKDQVLRVLFTDSSFMDEAEQYDFINEYFMLWSGYRNYCDSGFMEDLLTGDMAVQLWEVCNYSCYLYHVRSQALEKSLLDNMVELADEALAEGDVAMHARFGHDVVLNAFYNLMNIDGQGHLPASADEVKYWFQTYNTPKASTFLMVFYKSKREKDVLFKVLRNGFEVRLPQFRAVEGCYYKWEDLKEWHRNL